MPIGTRVGAVVILSLALSACSRGPAVATVPAPAPMTERVATPFDGTTQLVMVVTPAWDSTSGTLRRYERDAATSAWHPVGREVPIVVGQTGVAWDDRQRPPRTGEPIKREGDGRSPAGAFALDTAFGFDAGQSAPWIHLPYVALRATTECVDDARSVHYNTIVDRDRVPLVDWTSSEHMRRIEQYVYGVHVAYNAPPAPGRGSCIFLHVWAGPESVTAGCTAMEIGALKELIAWLDPRRHPMLVQLPASAAERMRGEWRLP